VGLAVIGGLGNYLVLNWNGTSVPLQAHRRNVYFGRKPGSDEIVSVGIVEEGGQPIHYVQINSSPAERFRPDRSFVPRPEIWTQYAGRYTGADDLRVRVQGGRLLVYVADEGREVACVAVGPDRFACEFGVLEFAVQPDGSAPEVVFGRVYRLKRKE
jgi:hypothetical protein